MATALLAAGLAACGGGSQRVCAAGPLRVQLFGDSTVWGYDGAAANGTVASTTPASALQQWLDQRLGRGAVVVLSRAVSGTDSSQLLAGTDGLNAPWPQSVDAYLVVVDFGINDKLRQLGEASYAANLQRLVEAPATVVFQTPLPVVDGSQPAGISTSYAETMRAVATASKVVLADASAYALAQPGWFASYAPDGMHPNSAGYTLLAENVLGPALLPLLQHPNCGS